MLTGEFTVDARIWGSVGRSSRGRPGSRQSNATMSDSSHQIFSVAILCSFISRFVIALGLLNEAFCCFDSSTIPKINGQETVMECFRYDAEHGVDKNMYSYHISVNEC